MLFIGQTKFNQTRIHTALQQELRVLLDAVLVHTATRMSAGLVAEVQVVMRLVVTQLQDAHLQILMTLKRPSLAAVRAEHCGVNS